MDDPIIQDAPAPEEAAPEAEPLPADHAEEIAPPAPAKVGSSVTLVDTHESVCFPAGHPAAGLYRRGEVYQVGEQLSQDAAVALVAGGQFAWADAQQEE